MLLRINYSLLVLKKIEKNNNENLLIVFYRTEHLLQDGLSFFTILRGCADKVVFISFSIVSTIAALIPGSTSKVEALG